MSCDPRSKGRQQKGEKGLVRTGAGFIGCHLADGLVTQGHGPLREEGRWLDHMTKRAT